MSVFSNEARSYYESYEDFDVPDQPRSLPEAVVKAQEEARVSLQMRELERPAMHRVLSVVARHLGIPLKDLLAEIRAE